ncbi:hypothetical protein TM49_06435 [Martelella endophytica]|uniref:Uncharacterized protein n=1 Tax=Martelella endophytica TaxID=1486262 RepID=A0A0D5LMI9_MAREN|nr:hypothetical protein TM49_06435 [Martelella endophytica]
MLYSLEGDDTIDGLIWKGYRLRSTVFKAQIIRDIRLLRVLNRSDIYLDTNYRFRRLRYKCTTIPFACGDIKNIKPTAHFPCDKISVKMFYFYLTLHSCSQALAGPFQSRFRFRFLKQLTHRRYSDIIVITI